MLFAIKHSHDRGRDMLAFCGRHDAQRANEQDGREALLRCPWEAIANSLQDEVEQREADKGSVEACFRGQCREVVHISFG